MTMIRATLMAIAAAGLICTPATLSAQSASEMKPHVPLEKSIGQSKPEVVPSLFVLNSRGASLKDGKLVLTGISPNAIVFADRPVRAAGHDLTARIVEDWGHGSDNFAKDPPNATVSGFKKDGSAVLDTVVVLKSPKLEGDKLTISMSTCLKAISPGPMDLHRSLSTSSADRLRRCRSPALRGGRRGAVLTTAAQRSPGLPPLPEQRLLRRILTLPPTHPPITRRGAATIPIRLADEGATRVVPTNGEQGRGARHVGHQESSSNPDDAAACNAGIASDCTSASMPPPPGVTGVNTGLLNCNPRRRSGWSSALSRQ